jgi:hypothetical protein
MELVITKPRPDYRADGFRLVMSRQMPSFINSKETQPIVSLPEPSSFDIPIVDI